MVPIPSSAEVDALAAVARSILTQAVRKLPNAAMSAIRLFVPVPIRSGDDLWLDGERAHYLTRVLRVRSGDTIVVFDGRSGEYPAVIGEIDRQRVQLRPGPNSSRDLESPLSIRLIQGISRGERMDFVVQKATELGVQQITPVHTAYSVVRLGNDRAGKKIGHWERIAQGACEQCGRNILPVIDAAADLKEVLAEPVGGSRLILQAGSGESLGNLRQIDDSLTLLIGPEGGLNEAEIALAISCGFQPVSLGPRILRTETAALAAVAILQSRFGDFRRIDN
jgi:16S rRNA (uracil1498-N3)-methyltransferase